MAHKRFEAVRARWQDLRGRWFDRTARPGLLAEADEFVQQVDGFVAAIEYELAGWTTVLHIFQLSMMGLAIGSAVALLYTLSSGAQPGGAPATRLGGAAGR